MRADKLTSKFQEALSDAQTIALGNDHAYIEPVHVLQAMLRQTDGPVALLQRAGVKVNQLNEAAEAQIKRLPQVQGQSQVQVGRELVTLLQAAEKDAIKRGDQYVASELFFLALADAKGVAGELARKHGLIIFADEIYDKTLFDGNQHTSIASLAEDVLFVTFNGLSKNYRSCGYRAGWMVVSGAKHGARDYIEGLNMLASMRLCANTPGQLAIQTALGGYQSIQDLVAPTGRLCRQRDLAYQLLSEIPGVSVVKPKAALYMFPRLDPEMYPITDDQQFAYDLLAQEKVLVVQGTGFNYPTPDHFRLVFLPNTDDLTEAVGRIAHYLSTIRR